MFRIVATVALSTAIAGPAASQSLAGLKLGDTEAAAMAVLGPGYARKTVSGRPGASALVKDYVSVIICNGVVSNIRASRLSDLFDYGREVQLESNRQGLAHSMITYGETGPMRTVLLSTNWRGSGFATQVDLGVVGSSTSTGTLLSREYKSDPNPCPRSE